MNVVIRPAIAADAASLSELAARTFRETFEPHNTADDMAFYMAKAFGVEKQAAEIADPAGVILLAEVQPDADGSELAGYAHLVTGASPAALHGRAAIEIKRFYVASRWHGRGVAQSLMDAALDTARDRGADSIWLGVWERNDRAIAFYMKCGFVRIGEHTFMLGKDAQTDWLLARDLP